MKNRSRNFITELVSFLHSKILILIFALLPFLLSFVPQEAHVNQKKIEQEKKKKQKEAQKQYDIAVKRHQQIQSRETKKRMKETKKESKIVTPLQH
jgi:hypothetical protein